MQSYKFLLPFIILSLFLFAFFVPIPATWVGASSGNYAADISFEGATNQSLLIDQYCIPLHYHWAAYPVIGPYYQEVEVGMMGYLRVVDVFSEVGEPGGTYWGCGPDVTAKISVMRYFDNWRSNTPSQLEPYIIDSKIVTWYCQGWQPAVFDEQNDLYFYSGEKLVIFLDGEVWSPNCGFGEDQCLVFMAGSGYGPSQGEFGFWDAYGNNHHWKTWPGNGGTDLGFRTWVSTNQVNLYGLFRSGLVGLI